MDAEEATASPSPSLGDASDDGTAAPDASEAEVVVVGVAEVDDVVVLAVDAGVLNRELKNRECGESVMAGGLGRETSPPPENWCKRRRSSE